MVPEKTKRVIDMTVDDLRELIRETVREVLEELLDEDPDSLLELKPEVEEYLRKALQGELETVPWDVAKQELNLDD